MDENSSKGMEKMPDKEFEFTSTRGLGRATLRMRSKVKVLNDRLCITVENNKKNVPPEVRLEEIKTIELSKIVTRWHIVLDVLACFNILFISLWWVLIIPVLIIAGINTKILIVQKNGVDVILYSCDREDAEKFRAYVIETIQNSKVIADEK